MIRMAPNRKQEQRNTTRATGANSAGARSNKAQCRNQGSPQPGSPRSQRAAIPAWHTPWHFEANTDNAGSQRKWWEELPQWNRRVKHGLVVKKTAKLRHSGRAQSPLSCPFSSISITHAVVRSTTVLVLLQVIFMVWKICAHHPYVVISVHWALPMTC